MNVGSLGDAVMDGKIWGYWAGFARQYPQFPPSSGDSQRTRVFLMYRGTKTRIMV